MKGWHNEPDRHALAARGIETKSYVEPLKAKAPSLKLEYPSDILTKENVNTILEYAKKAGHDEEWICDLDLIGDKVIVDDGKVGTVDESFMSWDKKATKEDPYDDPHYCIGYLHSHPPEDFPWFSSTDFILAFKIHNMRTDENLARCPWTYMGLVADGKLQLIAVKPKPGREKDFDGLEEKYVTDLEGTHEKTLQLESQMHASGELIRFEEIPLNIDRK